MDVLVERFQRRKDVTDPNSQKLYYLRQKPKTCGKVDIDVLAASIQKNCAMTKGDVKHVIEALVEEIQTNLANGDKVKLNQLGTLHMTFRCPGVEKSEDCTVRNISKVNIRFVPQPLTARVTLTGAPRDSMVIATPFAGHPRAFYYNQKINCLRAAGEVVFDGETRRFDPETATAVLDWGRGVWTYQNTWYWGSASGYVDGVPFGMNLGYGFGDTRAATENMLLYDGVAHKLDQVDFGIPKDAAGKDDLLAPWHVTDNLGRLDLTFTPILDRAAYTGAVVLESNQHQVFGRFDGMAVLDDGTVLAIRGLRGFAEKVKNRW